MADPPPWAMSVLGGALIGGAAALLWLWNGRIAGVSGITGRVLQEEGVERSWRLTFLLGLVAGGALMSYVRPDAFEPVSQAPTTTLFAGLIVGIGTSLANGCTSGHGVCGVSRLSARSLVATGTFVVAAMFVVHLVRHLLRAVP